MFVAFGYYPNNIFPVRISRISRMFMYGTHGNYGMFFFNEHRLTLKLHGSFYVRNSRELIMFIAFGYYPNNISVSFLHESRE